MVDSQMLPRRAAHAAGEGRWHGEGRRGSRRGEGGSHGWGVDSSKEAATQQ